LFPTLAESVQFRSHCSPTCINIRGMQTQAWHRKPVCLSCTCVTQLLRKDLYYTTVWSYKNSLYSVPLRNFDVDVLCTKRCGSCIL